MSRYTIQFSIDRGTWSASIKLDGTTITVTALSKTEAWLKLCKRIAHHLTETH